MMSSREAQGFADAIEVGVVVRPHGVRGQLKLRLHNPHSTLLAHARPEQLALRLPSGDLRFGLCPAGSPSGGWATLRVDGCTDREQAEALRGAVVVASRETVRLADGEYLYVDLVGCEVVEGDVTYGRVEEVFHSGATDVLVVRCDAQERLIPFVDPWVGEIDVHGRRIQISGGEHWEPHQTGRRGRRS